MSAAVTLAYAGDGPFLERMVSAHMTQNAMKNENAVIIPLVSREQICLSESQSLVDRLFKGSSRLFLTNFLSKEEFTEEEAAQLKALIDRQTRSEEGGKK